MNDPLTKEQRAADISLTERPTDEAVWLTAWCAVASAWNCRDTSAASRWADSCLKDFRERFTK